jgi:hypothetical protein
VIGSYRVNSPEPSAGKNAIGPSATLRLVRVRSSRYGLRSQHNPPSRILTSSQFGRVDRHLYRKPLLFDRLVHFDVWIERPATCH